MTPHPSDRSVCMTWYHDDTTASARSWSRPVLHQAFRCQAAQQLMGPLGPRADVARVEDRTFIARRRRSTVERTNNGVRTAGGGECPCFRRGLAEGLALRGRTRAAARPFPMGPLGSAIGRGFGARPSRPDSPYVFVGLHAHHGPHRAGALEVLGPDGDLSPASTGSAPPRAGPGRRRLAVPRGEQVHRALPRDARDRLLRVGLGRSRRSARRASPSASRWLWPATDWWMAEHC